MIKLQKNLELDRCPYCNVASPNLAKIWETDTVTHQNNNRRWWKVYACSACGGVVIASSQQNNSGDIYEYYPNSKTIDESIPSPSKEYLFQALDSLHAPAGCIMLCASSVDSMLKIKEYKEGSLYSRINKAAEDHLITDEMSKWAHEVRLDTNDQRYPNEDVELPKYEDAQKTLDFVLALAEYLFVLPSKVKRGLTKGNDNKDN